MSLENSVNANFHFDCKMKNLVTPLFFVFRGSPIWNVTTYTAGTGKMLFSCSSGSENGPLMSDDPCLNNLLAPRPFGKDAIVTDETKGVILRIFPDLSNN